MKIFEEICKVDGTRFKFVTDQQGGLNVEYMTMPKEGDDYWITPIINIQKGDAFLGNISRFKSDDAIMKDKVTVIL